MAEINWTLEAERWLKDIHDYISLDNPAAAQKVVKEIYQKTQLLVRFPKLGQRYDALPKHPTHILLYGHYRIAYRIKTDNNIDILGVFHGALEIDKYLY